jgi:plastocyanin
MRMRGLAFLLVVLALALGAAACGGGGSGGSSSTKEGSSSSKELELDDYYFEPKTVQGNAGQKITLELKNEGSTEHNLTLSDQGIDQDVEEGESAKVTVTVPQSGSVQFYCKYHRSMGMTGTLKVSSSPY